LNNYEPANFVAWSVPGADETIGIRLDTDATILISGPDGVAKTSLFRSLGGGGAALYDIGSGIGVSKPTVVTIHSNTRGLMAKGVRVTLRIGGAAKWDVEQSATSLARWLDDSGQQANIVVLDGIANSPQNASNIGPFMAAVRRRVNRPITGIVGLPDDSLSSAMGRTTNIAGSIFVGDHGVRDVVSIDQTVVRFDAARSRSFLTERTEMEVTREPLSGDFGRSFDISPPPPSPPRRHVNSRILNADDHNDVPPGVALTQTHGYELVVTIGRQDERSLLRDSQFPDAQLPVGGIWLKVLVHIPQISEFPVQQDIYLPPTGDSWICNCPPGSAVHSCQPNERMPAAPIPFRPRAGDSLITVRVAVYFQAVVVHSHELSLPIGGKRSITARTIYSLTRSFDDLEPFRNRSLSVMTTDSASGTEACAYINGVAIDPMAYSFDDLQTDNSSRQVRRCLFDMHLKQVGTKWESKYSATLGKTADDFCADLLSLAKLGRALFMSIFRSSQASQIRQLLSHEAQAGLVTIQFARPTTERLSIPWQMMYALPMQSADPAPFVCKSVAEFGPNGRPSSWDSGRCPHESDHPSVGRSVLCPFGFWGLAHIVEVPPHVGNERSLARVVESDQTAPLATVIGWNDKISTNKDALAEATRHLDHLRQSRLGVLQPEARSNQELGIALGPADMDLVYLYCHGQRQTIPGAAVADTVLVLENGDSFTPQDVQGWSEFYNWPGPHWPDRRPLVVLNACHTGEILAASLSNFVSAFVETAGASGVIATEITLEQKLAGLAMETFFAGLLSGLSTGEAMRDMRWSLLSRGNLMGLAYSNYSAADLRLRP
jgi:hypothetical protein